MKSAIVFFCAFITFMPQTFAAETLRLALNWKAEPQFGGFYAAQDFFKKEKLNVEINQGGSGTPTLQMLLSGKTEFAIVSADELVIAHDRGHKNVVALFAVYQKNPQGIMLHAQNPAKNLSELLHSQGRLLWQQGLPYAQYLMKKESPVKITSSPYAGGLGPFIADKNISQQCFVTSEPLIAKRQNIPVKTFLIADSGYNPYTTVVATTQEFLKSHRQQTVAFVQSVRAGWKSYLANPQSANAEMMKLNPAMDAQTFAESAKAQQPLIQEDLPPPMGLGGMTLVRWQTLADQLFDLKVTKNRLKGTEFFENIQ